MLKRPLVNHGIVGVGHFNQNDFQVRIRVKPVIVTSPEEVSISLKSSNCPGMLKNYLNF